MVKCRFVIIYGILSLVLMVGCANEGNVKSDSEKSITITQVSSKQVYDQTYANEAKQTLSKKKDIQKIVAVNTDKLLIIAIEIPHHERFKLTKINKELSKEMDKKFKKEEIKVELSTDKKIFLELEALEKKLQKDTITKKELKKQLKHISNLLKEQT